MKTSTCNKKTTMYCTWTGNSCLERTIIYSRVNTWVSSYKILENFTQNKFRISPKNASCFAKFRVLKNWLLHAKDSFVCFVFRVTEHEQTKRNETATQKRINTVTLKQIVVCCVWWVGVCGECNVVNVCVVSVRGEWLCGLSVFMCVECVWWVSVCGDWVCVVSVRLCGDCVAIVWRVCENVVSVWWVCGECMSVWRGCACVVSVCAVIECVWGVCVCD